MYLSAAEAARRLGVSRTTLYSYVSRGLVGSHGTSGTRERRYSAADVEAMVQRKRARRDPNAAAAEALGVRGLPVLESALSSIDEGVLRYRGRDVIALAKDLPRRAEGGALEAVAELLWGGPLPEDPAPVVAGPLRRALAGMPLIEGMHTWLAAAGAADGAAHNLKPDSVRATGARILRGVTQTAAARSVKGMSVAEGLASAWCPASDVTARSRIDAALVLCADHELNVSAFTARCVASARGTPYMVVTAALAALHGHRHGGETERAAALIDEEGTPGAVLAARLRRGEHIPGFGHPLYPDGDPRGRLLLALARKGASTTRIRGFARAGRSLLSAHPTLDLGLVALCRSMQLPPHAPLALFAIGRTIGWVAHALEQYEREPMIRPRARYVGPEPTDAPL